MDHQKVTTRIYRVPGISCDHCKHAIEGEVSKVAGVDQVDVDIDQRIVTVEATRPTARCARPSTKRDTTSPP